MMSRKGFLFPPTDFEVGSQNKFMPNQTQIKFGIFEVVSVRNLGPA